jgi:uncharacterized phage protein gp47/JayE
VYLGADTQDGQMLAIVAQAIFDSNQACIAVYNQMNPASAQGAGLSSVVKINGISRNIASNSQADLLVGGSVGVVILNGVAQDINGNLWALPASVTIPPAGQILVTATCTALGAIAANPGTINKINTPVLGWSTVTNPSAASEGAPVEDDANLRRRQTQSVALPALTVLAATTAAVEALTGVTEVATYENDTGSVDVNGPPPHSIALVVTGGTDIDIATAIMIKKTPGCFTYGDTTVPVEDSIGIVHNISFFRPTNVPIGVRLTIKALQGYTGSTGDAVKAALADYVTNTLRIGQDVVLAKLYLPAQLNGGAGSEQFDLETLLIGPQAGPFVAADIPIGFRSQATLLVGDVVITVI